MEEKQITEKLFSSTDCQTYLFNTDYRQVQHQWWKENMKGRNDD